MKPATPSSSEPLFDAFAAGLIENPYPHYDRLRATEPVYWEQVLGLWVLTRYDDVLRVLNEPNFETANVSQTIAQFGRKMRRDYGPLIRAADSILFFTNGERHKRDRRTLSRVLTRIPLSRLLPAIREFAEVLAKALSAETEFDAALDYADALPGLVMTRILGLPATDARLFLGWANNFVRLFDVVPPSVYDRLNQQATMALAHLRNRIMHPPPEADQAGLSLICEATPGEGEEKLAAAAALAFTLFMVGSETTASLIASCISTILQRPDLYAHGRENPSLAARIVAEVARLESPVQRVVRVAREDCAIGDRTIRRGDRVLLLLGAANRDPLAFPQPSELALDRNADDVAFGGGKHLCLGKSLAMSETEVAVQQFLTLPQLELVNSGTDRHPGLTIRRLTHLPVRFCGGMNG